MSETIIYKTCRDCNETKPISEFSKHIKSKDGHLNYCKTCCLKYQKKYRQTEKGKQAHRKANKKYQKTEKGKVVHYETNKKYQKTEKGKVVHRKADIKYRKSDKGKATLRAKKERHHVRNPNQRKARNAVNLAIRTGKIPCIDSLQCLCGNQAKQYHHHKGYAPEFWLDVVPVCRKCHIKHHNQS